MSRSFKSLRNQTEHILPGNALKIAEVKRGQRNLVLTGKIARVSSPRDIQTRYGPAKVATATLEDETGSISFNLWRAQIDWVKENDLIRIENAFANSFRDTLELNIGADGKIVVLSREGKQVTVEQSAARP